MSALAATRQEGGSGMRVLPLVLDPAYTPYGVEKAQRAYDDALIHDVLALMHDIRANPGMRHYCDLTKYLYDWRKPEGFEMSGANCAQWLFSGLKDKNYGLTSKEISLIDCNSPLLNSLFSGIQKKKGGIVHVSLGCGPYSSIFGKDAPFAQTINAGAYVAVDINARQAQKATETIREGLPDIATAFLPVDFTKPFELPSFAGNPFPVLTLFGDTIGQFSGKSLQSLLTNLGEATGYRGALIPTLDDAFGKPAEESYRGIGLQSLMLTLWGTINEVVKDQRFNPKAFRFEPEFDELTSSVRFVHEARTSTPITIMGEPFRIPAYEQIDIGGSQKKSVEQFTQSLGKNSGWIASPVRFRRDSTADAVILVGKNTPPCIRKQFGL